MTEYEAWMFLRRKKRDPKPSLPEDMISILRDKNPKLDDLIETFELEVNY